MGYFLARCTDNWDGRRRPPVVLRVTGWAEAYALFLPSLGGGRSPGQFRRSLQNTRDAFDALFDNGRVGWWKDGAPAIGERERGIHRVWQGRPDAELWRAVSRLATGAGG